MRIQSQLLLIMVCINAGMAFADGLGALNILPGYSLTHPISNSTFINGTDSLVQYGNATDNAVQWSASPPSVIGVIGDIVGSLPGYFKVIVDLIGGFPILIIQIGNMFPLDSISELVVVLFASAMATIWGFLMLSYVFELISGRMVNE